MTNSAHPRHYVSTFLKYALLVFASFVAIVPIISCIVTAFKTGEEYASTSVMTMPQSWLYFENFTEAWKQIWALRSSTVLSSWCAYWLVR